MTMIQQPQLSYVLGQNLRHSSIDPGKLFSEQTCFFSLRLLVSWKKLDVTKQLIRPWRPLEQMDSSSDVVAADSREMNSFFAFLQEPSTRVVSGREFWRLLCWCFDAESSDAIDRLLKIIVCLVRSVIIASLENNLPAWNLRKRAQAVEGAECEARFRH